MPAQCPHYSRLSCITLFVFSSIIHTDESIPMPINPWLQVGLSGLKGFPVSLSLSDWPGNWHGRKSRRVVLGHVSLLQRKARNLISFFWILSYGDVALGLETGCFPSEDEADVECGRAG